MCGIAGIVSVHPDEELSAAVRRMTALQAHRGPDGDGFFDAPGVSLGHRRLAIIDLSDSGRQPMTDASGRYWLTYNGEIYNYLELRSELASLGHQFRSHSDSEVLLAAYAEWGADALVKLRGMFAFAIWDSHASRLFAARDRLGIKPFHYASDGERFRFASEIKALLEFVPERRPVASLVRQYLAWNLLDHEVAATMVEGIHRLPPGHFLTFDAQHGLRIASYWSLRVSDQLRAEPQQRERLIDEFREQFAAAVSLHLRSDVEVGSCLSGGLDSSAIVCVANRELKERAASHRQHSFSAQFPGSSIDETGYIEDVARATGCETHFVTPTADGFLADFDDWLSHQDEPVGGTSTYAQYCVARLAREAGVKVLLDGQGADEQLAGYRKFILVYIRQLARAGRVAAALRNAAAFFGSREIVKTMRIAEGKRYLFEKHGDAALWNASAPPRPSGLGVGGTLARRIEADLNAFSLPVLLRYEDRNTMAFGIESRVPFVDHVFVEWMAALPADLRLDGGWTKVVMREALRGVLPERIRKRKSKIGFSTPESDWMRGALGRWALDVLAAPKHLLDVVERKGLDAVVARFRGGDRARTTTNLVFRLAMYEAWGRKVLAA